MSAFYLLIVDANILFSFFKSNSSRRHLIKKLLNTGVILVSPDFVFEELLNNKEKIINFSRISEAEFKFLFFLLEKNIKSYSKKTYEKLLSESLKISPHTKDSAYFALALKLNSPIWSDEKKFKQQNKVKIFSTNQLLKGLLK